MQWNEIKDSVRDYLNRPNTPDASLDSWAAMVTSDLNRQLTDHPLNNQMASVTFDPGSDTFLQMPEDLRALTVIRFGTQALTQLSPARADSGASGYILHGLQAELFPTPVEISNFVVEYQGKLLVPSDQVTDNWVVMNHPDVYIYGMLKEASVYLRKADQVALWSMEYQRRVDDLINQGWDMNYSVSASTR
jgi:hypothetical protein